MSSAPFSRAQAEYAAAQRLHGMQTARHVCVMVAHGTPCLGPVTHAGCGALCPSYNRGCYGCFGPKETPHTGSLAHWMSDKLGMFPSRTCCARSATSTPGRSRSAKKARRHTKPMTNTEMTTKIAEPGVS